jgi:hypothetical protein
MKMYVKTLTNRDRIEAEAKEWKTFAIDDVNIYTSIYEIKTKFFEQSGIPIN